MNKVKLKVKQDYATHDGMLYKDTKVFINEEHKNIWTTQSKIKVKDGMGKIWFIEPSFLELV